MIKIAIDSGPLTGGHSVRGIGVMVREQIASIKKLGDREIVLEVADFEKIDLSKYDVVHYPYFFPYALTLPAIKPAKKVIVTIQDLIQLIYPDRYPPGVRGKINFIKQKARLKNVDAVITITETSKKDIVRFLGIPSEKIHVVYLAPKEVFKKISGENLLTRIRKKYNLPSKFVLYVGDVNFNKNIPNLIKACKIAKIPLVICGKHAREVEEEGLGLKDLKGPQDWLRFVLGKSHPELVHYKALRELFKDGIVVRSGFVPDKDLVIIYNLAAVYVQPAFYEGFGLPVLEAMACGTPVVISKTNALVEIAGGAALIAYPKSSKDIANKVTEILKNRGIKEELIKKGFERARDFSWQKTAKEMLEVYRLVAAD